MPENEPSPSLPPSQDPLDARLEAVLRARPLPEPEAWFAARTVARLRHEGPARRFDWLARLSEMFSARSRWAAALGLVLLLALGGVGIHRQHHEQSVTFAALDLVAQGGNPFTDEETTWPETSF